MEALMSVEPGGSGFFLRPAWLSNTKERIQLNATYTPRKDTYAENKSLPGSVGNHDHRYRPKLMLFFRQNELFVTAGFLITSGGP